MDLENISKEKQTWEPRKYKWYDAVPVVGGLTNIYRNQERASKVEKMENRSISTFDQIFFAYQSLATLGGLMTVAAYVEKFFG